jgi:hypothetical protein
MKLEDLVKTALDELRMQMLGAQVLFGFQLQGAFQDNFKDALTSVKLTDFAALSLIVLTFGLLVAAPSQHRLVDGGQDTRRIFESAKQLAEFALAPLAVAIGCDVYVVAEHWLGPEVAALFGFFTAGVALIFWYGLGTGLRVTATYKEKAMKPPPEQKTDLHVKIDQMLTECRVILPGAQAMLGFQFVVTMTKAFAELPELVRDIHFAALGLVALAVTLLITPAAVHRITFRGLDAERVHGIGSLLVTAAMIPLAIGLSADFLVASFKMLDGLKAAAWAAGVVLVSLLALWYGLPLALRRRTLRLQR